jgi:hypothetical protein
MSQIDVHHKTQTNGWDSTPTKDVASTEKNRRHNQNEETLAACQMSASTLTPSSVLRKMSKSVEKLAAAIEEPPPKKEKPFPITIATSVITPNRIGNGAQYNHSPSSMIPRTPDGLDRPSLGTTTSKFDKPSLLLNSTNVSSKEKKKEKNKLTQSTPSEQRAYAGPKFMNSPPPSELPLFNFASMNAVDEILNHQESHATREEETYDLSVTNSSYLAFSPHTSMDQELSSSTKKHNTSSTTSSKHQRPPTHPSRKLPNHDLLNSPLLKNGRHCASLSSVATDVADEDLAQMTLELKALLKLG